MEIKEIERKIKETQRKRMLMLLEHADKTFMGILNKQKDEAKVSATKKICEVYKAFIVKIIEANTHEL